MTHDEGMKRHRAPNDATLAARALPAVFRKRLTRGAFFGLVGDALLFCLAGGAVAALARFFLPGRAEGDVTNAVVPGSAAAIVPGSGLLFAFGKRPALLVRDEAGGFTAFLATCTHLACTVTYDPARRQIVCPCHQGLFDLEGKVVGGPPPRPLERLDVELDGDTIHVFRS